MKSAVRWSAAALAAAVVLAGSGWAAPAAAPAPKKGPRIAVEPAAFDFGATLPQKTLTKEFVLRNVGDGDLAIEAVTTSCGCTAALPAERLIKPGQQTPLRVSVETRSARGRVDRFVYVRSNDKTQSNLTIALSFTVGAPNP
jgi:hypothetical protein